MTCRPGLREGEEDNASRFRAWESIARTIARGGSGAAPAPLLDDLHWADTSTLRVLRLLAETTESGRLMVVGTWRHEPPPTGQLAEVADMLARRHALRLELTGLTAEEAGEIVTSVANTSPTSSEAQALRHARTATLLPGRIRPPRWRGRRSRCAAGRGAPACCGA